MISWNDRRKAKKAASATMKTTLGQMAKSGSLRATTTTPGQREFGKAERAAVNKEVADVNRQYGPTDQPGITGSRAKRWDIATKKVDKATDVGGFDAPAYRKMDAQNNKRGQQKKFLPRKAGK